MIKKKTLALILAVGLATSTALVGCNRSTVENDKNRVENATDNAGKDVENGVEKIGDDVKKGAEGVGDAVKNGVNDIGEAGVGLWDKVKDMSMTYDEDDFKKEIEKKGYKLNKVENSKSLLSVENDDYTINGDKISIYEYDEGAKSTLEGDLRSITDNGMMINGSKVSWTNAAHIYKKGRVIVIYDGNNESVLTALKEVLGEPLL